MTDNTPDNLVLEHLRAIRGDMDEVKANITEIKTTQAAVLQLMSAHETRLSRIEGDIAFIKRRLDIADAPAE